MADVVRAIAPDEVVAIQGAEEDVSFVLPRELRRLPVNP